LRSFRSSGLNLILRDESSHRVAAVIFVKKGPPALLDRSVECLPIFPEQIGQIIEFQFSHHVLGAAI
jgi:hypothetical protein